MKHQPITEKQAKNNKRIAIYEGLLGVVWIVLGITYKEPYEIVMGGVFILLCGVMYFYTDWQRKNFPIEDPQADAILEKSAKDGRTGMTVFFGIITVAFLIAFGLAMLLKK